MANVFNVAARISEAKEYHQMMSEESVTIDIFPISLEEVLSICNSSISQNYMKNLLESKKFYNFEDCILSVDGDEYRDYTNYCIRATG